MDVEKMVKGILSDLRKYLSRERGRASLERLEDDFYEKVREAIKVLEEAPEGDQKQARIAKSSFKKLIELRVVKIISSLLKEEDVLGKLTREERELYNQVKRVIEEYKRRTLEEERRELSIISIIEEVKEPIVDSEGRVLVLSKGDVLCTSKEVCSLLERAGIGRRIR